MVDFSDVSGDMEVNDQHYSLRWNDFTLKIVTAFQSLRDEEDFVDVTLACDGHQYSAHKMVLSACSPYFRMLLRSNPCQHPIVILKDVGHLEMERLLEFMYNGEVNIAQDQLAAFLKTSENLKIRGLAGSSDDTEQYHNKDISQFSGGCGIFPLSMECKEVDGNCDDSFSSSSSSIKKKKRECGSSSQNETDVTPSEDILDVRVETNNIALAESNKEMKPEPDDASLATNHVYVDDDSVQQEGMDSRSIGFPLVLSTPSGSMTSNLEASGDVSTLMAIANAVNVTAPSDNPIKCPLCQGIIKHARNLRRHVFKRHLPAAQRGEITEGDVKNVLEKKLKSITVTPLTDEELQSVRNRIRRRGVGKGPRKLKGIAALPQDVNGSNIDESEITIRKISQKKREVGETPPSLPLEILGDEVENVENEDILQEALNARDKSNDPQDEVMNLATPQNTVQQLTPGVSQDITTAPSSQPISLAVSGSNLPVPRSLSVDVPIQSVRLQTDSPLALHREHTMSLMSFDSQVPISEALSSYHPSSSSSQVAQQSSSSATAAVSGYIPGSYWSTPSMAGLPGSSFQTHQSMFTQAHADYFPAGVHMVRPPTIDRVQQHRRKPY